MPVKRLGAVTGETYYAAVGAGGFDTAVVGPRGYLTRLAARANVALPPTTDVDDAAPVLAHLNRDRWLAACDDCRGDFQLAWEGESVYMCPRCWNAEAGGRWRRVAFPAARDQIERAASAIADPRERNWLPGWSPMRVGLESGNGRQLAGPELWDALTARGRRN